jgi:protein-tyrosine phosphatase
MPPSQPEAAAPQAEDFEVVHDAGGLPVPGGHVRAGRIFRFSGALLRRSDLDALADRGVRLIVDLRGDGEHVGELSRWAAAQGVDYHHEPIDVASPDVLAARGSGLSPRDAESWLRDIYRYLVDHHATRFAAAIEAVSGMLPAAFGCAAGKDRTGLLAALIQTLLGVQRDDVAGHYTAAPPPPDRLAPLAVHQAIEQLGW